MATLLPGEFEIDGLAFGGERHALVVPPDGFDTGSVGWLTQDTQSPIKEITLMGRDRQQAPTWTFDLWSNTQSASEAMDAFNALADKWLGAPSRGRPGALSVLRYNLDGRTRRVYGRPRKWAQTVPPTTWEGVAKAICEFKLSDPNIYDDYERSLTLTVLPESSGGLMTPLVTPLTTERQAGYRTGVIDDPGNVSTPVRCVIRGPVTNPFITVGGYTIHFKLTLGYGQTITYDARYGTAVRETGVSVVSAIDYSARLDMRVSVSRGTELRYGGIDPSVASTATFYWRSAYRGL